MNNNQDNSNLIPFNFQDKEIRFIEINKKHYAVGIDVAEALGYADSGAAVCKLIDKEDTCVAKIATQGQKRSVTLINEAGIYQLIIKSKLPAAKEFKHWLFKEVLPSIRKTGKYELNSESNQEKLPQRDAVDYIEASSLLLEFPDSKLKRLLEYRLISELEINNVNQKMLGEKEVQKHFTTANVRAGQLGYSSKQIGNGQALGKFIKLTIAPAFQDWQGQYKVWHYEASEELDTRIHAFFLTRSL